jgi:hypothetical protein
VSFRDDIGIIALSKDSLDGLLSNLASGDGYVISRRHPIPEVIAFIKDWVGDVDKSHRIPKSEIPRYLPTPLRAIYHEFGNYPPRRGRKRMARYAFPLFSVQDYLLPLSRIRRQGDRITFLAENQGVFYCTTQVNADDPAVQVHWSGNAEYDVATGEPFDICCKRLSQFLTTFCLQEVALGSPHVCCVDGNSTEITSICVRRCKRIWINGPYIDRAYEYSYYLCDNRVIVFRWGTQFWLCANDWRYLDLIDPSLELTPISGKLPADLSAVRH